MRPVNRLLTRRVRGALTHVLSVALLAGAALALGTAPAHAAKPAGASSPPTHDRAMWVWDQPAARSLVRFAESHHVTDLFLAVPREFGSSAALPWVRSIHDAVAGKGIRLHALGGDPGWIDDPSAAVAWQDDALASGLFVGSHVDIEPWVRADWQSDNAAVVERYLATLTALAEATNLPVEADIAFWLYQVGSPAGTALDAAVLQRVDAVTILSYRNTASGPDSITGVAAETLAAARWAGKPARLAVETRYLGDDAVARKQTFYGQADTALDRAMREVDALAAGNSSYRGIGVHDYTGWDALRG